MANDQGADKEYLEKEFDFKDLYKKGKKRKTTGIMDCMDAALLANPDKDWNYIVPGSSSQGYCYANLSAISEENAASAETTSTAMLRLNEETTRLAETSVELKKLADNLKEDLEFFDIIEK